MTTLPIDRLGAFVGAPSVLVDGAADGPLAGTTLGVKDLFDVVGTVTRAGNPDFAAGRPVATSNAPAVDRLVAAGATVVGRTVSDELAFSLSGTNVHDGTPINPAAPGRVPGGSSAGSAAAVGDGLIDLGLGTDTGGSIRVPASYCGVVGWRPTHGRVAAAGLVALAPSFDTVGLLGADVEKVRVGAEALLPDEDASSAGSNVIVVDETLALLVPDVRAAFTAACAGLGASDTIALGVDLDEAFTAFRTRQGFEAWQTHGAWIESRRPSMGQGIAARFAAAATVTSDALGPADEVRAAVRDRVMEGTAEGRILLIPAAAGPAPPVQRDPAAHEADRMRTLRLGCVAGLAGAPVVVLPVGRVDGLPLGVAAVGAPGSDRSLLEWAMEAMVTVDGLTPDSTNPPTASRIDA